MKPTINNNIPTSIHDVSYEYSISSPFNYYKEEYNNPKENPYASLVKGKSNGFTLVYYPQYTTPMATIMDPPP